MIKLNHIWNKLKSSKSGWFLAVTSFALLFAFMVSLLTAIIGLPVLINENYKYADEVVGLIFPLVILVLSFLTAKVIARKRQKSIKELLGLRKPNKKAVYLTVLLAIVYIILLVISMIILQLISPNLAGQEQAVAEMVSNSTSLSLVVMVFSVGLITPIAEETFFRGLLLSLYSRKIKVIASIFFVAVLFGLAHGQVNVGIDTFIFGIILGILTWKTESIIPAIFLHMLKNCLAIIAILYS
ncbi:MAG: CPBP family intramembrane metalloprotease [Candidatus Nomurabacteria bacterium]|nr:MAG: CPBP family intramembrane metalloprotease [Candidatus Nomurabacteria bacterium]HRV75790.1 type II CAAX endopeptidase family protein [Candidatus Saccharimonadales bacterium]